MSQSRSPGRFDRDALPIGAAEAAGYQLIPEARAHALSFKRADPVSPHVETSFQSVGAGYIAPVVHLGVYVDDFERDWQRRLLGTTIPRDFGFKPALSMHSLNIGSLRPRPWVPRLPSKQEVAEARDWFDRVFAYAGDLPNSFESLIGAIEAGRIVNHAAHFYFGHPVKVRGLVEWLSREHGVDVRSQVLPMLMHRVDPYDVNVMLGPG